MKRILSLVLALLMIAATFISCGGTGDVSDTDVSGTNDVANADTDAPTEETTTPPEPEQLVMAEYDISKFKIIYNALYNLDFAKEVQAKCKEIFDVSLTISRDSSKNESEFELIIGETTRETSKKFINYKNKDYMNHFGLGGNNGQVQFLGVDAQTIQKSINFFFKSCVNVEKKTISVPSKGVHAFAITPDSVNIPVKDDPAQIRFVTNNILQQYIKPSWNRQADLIGGFLLMDADIYALQECDGSYWHKTYKLNEELEKMGYAVVTDNLDTVNPIFYKADKFELIEGGYKTYDVSSLKDAKDRWYSYAVLKEKATGKQILVMSTHFIAGAADDLEAHRQICANELPKFVAEMQKKYPNAPLILGGDFNSNCETESYKILSEAFLSARESNATKKNMDYKTSCSVGKAPARGGEGTAIDHIFYTKGITPKHYEAIVSTYSYAYSDHVPVVLDFILN